MFQVMPVIDFKTDSSSHNPYLEQNTNKYEDKYQDLCKLKTCTLRVMHSKNIHH